MFRRLQPNDRVVLSSAALLVAVSALMYVGTIKQVIADLCPLIFDINGNGRIDITGHTSARQKVYTIPSLSRRVDFDMDADGNLESIDWVHNRTDGFLIDLRRGLPEGEIDGSWLFGNDLAGEHIDGFSKLATLDVDENGWVEGAELTGIGLWIDDGDARVSVSEIQALSDYDIVGLPVASLTKVDGYGGDISYQWAALADGDKMYIEDVWFMGKDQASDLDNSIAQLLAFLP